MLFSVAGSIPWNLALVTAGWVLGENYEALYEAIRPFEILIYVVVVLGGALVLFRWARGRGSPREV
jgi:membrane protein DedA with SNARE-associated domain